MLPNQLRYNNLHEPIVFSSSSVHTNYSYLRLSGFPRPGTLNLLPMKQHTDSEFSRLNILNDFRTFGDWYSLREWPVWAINAFFNVHKDRNERYRLFVFFYKNGMPPWHAVFWVMWHDTYDLSAWYSIADAYVETFTHEGRARLNRNTVLNIESGRVE